MSTAVWIVLSTWALLVPPYQFPDEVQHALRAGSVLVQPWIAGGDHFIVDQRRANPIARNPGPGLGWLFYHGDHHLDAADIAALRQRKWGEHPTVDWPLREVWAGASYPTLYHLCVFAIAQPLTAVLGATPYQSVYLFRLVSVTLTAALWAVVFGALTRELGRTAASRVLLLVLPIPMLVFASAGTNPDAVLYPIATLAILGCRRLLRGDGGFLAATSWLLLAALVKPSGLFLDMAIAGAALATWVAGGASRAAAMLVVGACVQAIAMAGAAFYLWSPPRFLGSGPVQDTLAGWASTTMRRVPAIWKMFWGLLGWLDYALPALWYKVLIVPVAANAAIALALLRRRRAELFLPLVLFAFIGIIVAGEYVYLSRTGYNVQGRHFLPAVVGLAPLVTHDRKLAAWSLLAFVGAMHVAFLYQTYLRYYGGELDVLLAALPFS